MRPHLPQEVQIWIFAEPAIRICKTLILTNPIGTVNMWTRELFCGPSADDKGATSKTPLDMYLINLEVSLIKLSFVENAPWFA